MMVFVSGGVRSGKSSFAEQVVEKLANNSEQVHYIATSKAVDAEMLERISRHKQDRKALKRDWILWEQPYNINNLISNFSSSNLILIDCLTILVANELFREGCNWTSKEYGKKLIQELLSTFYMLNEKCKHIVIVSNELFSSGIASDKGSYMYMYVLGNLHQAIVQACDEAYFVQFGIPQLMKSKNEMRELR
ncbi:bifunctional adenosylcobinamide kinase/adenosylcobinamide-phosphate guanylyltransferase [Cytobacillus sp. IB215665]|uniref:bifunctional adenosylcobinamide kinase/adenosylcobinamide-phosphate guanylyltransferase n=1 Tax=Cytobacillus sp. IB215665 TaxID=3097357 RepID=UPI002A0D0964|nr:bifunctional adenosylcobinamide kinase/adenosylcobinamide-phosphate guanylyltransferase [Cytobacillus sp. IB215665]MDX8364802.1 bifunctional adenosylcobinamide kinase/adenosylcobinamide-phosphate guanylyltransferase [Cytobacillus sp. IB215665]